jgi:hypothetical protein
MTTNTVAVQIPESLYHRLEQAAIKLQKPVENLLVETLQAALFTVDEIPEQIQAEIAILDNLDETALHDIAASEMIPQDQEMIEQLLDLQGFRPLSDEETDQLNRLRNEYGRVLLRKARAFALLAERGHPLPQG